MASRSDATVIDMPPSTNGGEPASPAATMALQQPTLKAADGDESPTSPAETTNAPPTPTVGDKVISSTANLAQLLPTGTVLAYQALAPSFTNHGVCNAANQWLTVVLVVVLTVSCLFFAFTDSVVGKDGKLYYGVATRRGLDVFNYSAAEEKEQWKDGELERLRIRPLDFVHAIFTALVFLTVAFSDVGLQQCFFGENPGSNTEELLKNLPLGMAFLSSFVFLVFPTKRKGIGYTDSSPNRKA